jgi:Ethanolamine utilization protein EutJ (predicted chaperonin)
LVGGPPGEKLQMVVDELPTGGTADIVPVVLATMDVGMVPKAEDGIVVVDGVIAFVPRAIDVVETMRDALDRIGTGGAAMEG